MDPVCHCDDVNEEFRKMSLVAFLWFVVYVLPVFITKTRLFKYIENFTFKHLKFSEKKTGISHISAQNIDCGYPLEPPRRGGSNEYP